MQMQNYISAAALSVDSWGVSKNCVCGLSEVISREGSSGGEKMSSSSGGQQPELKIKAALSSDQVAAVGSTFGVLVAIADAVGVGVEVAHEGEGPANETVANSEEREKS
jgi:hypothetical protein